MITLVRPREIESSTYSIDGSTVKVDIHWRNGGAFVGVKVDNRMVLSGFVTTETTNIEAAVHQVISKTCDCSDELETSDKTAYRAIADRILAEEFTVDVEAALA